LLVAIKPVCHLCLVLIVQIVCPDTPFIAIPATSAVTKGAGLVTETQELVFFAYIYGIIVLISSK
jgi:hypothetical protein